MVKVTSRVTASHQGGRPRRVELSIDGRVFAVINGKQTRRLSQWCPVGHPWGTVTRPLASAHHLVLLDEVVGGLPKWALRQLVEGMPWAHEDLPGEFRPKGTDEVAETSEDPSEESELHGGDGASGEVDHPADPPFGGVIRGGDEGVSAPVPEKAPGPSRCVFTPAPPKGKVARDLKRSLRRLFDSMLSEAGDEIGEDHPSPRYEGRAIAREMVSRRWDLARAHRVEVASAPRIVVAADTSGSCSAHAGVTVGLCEALAAIWPELLFLEHSNGAIGRVVSRGSEETLWDLDMNCPERTDWVSVLEGERVAGVVLFGDGDGYEHFSRVWEEAQCPVLWLDSYCACDGVQHRSCPVEGVHPLLSYWQGVNSSESAAAAIRGELRRKGG